MTTSVFQYGIPVTFTFGLDTTLASGVNVPPYPAGATKYTYTTTIKEGDADRALQLGPVGNQASFTLSVSANGLIATCTNCPNYGNVQGGSMVMELTLGVVAGASGYTMSAATGTQNYFMRGYVDGATSSPFVNEQTIGSWFASPFTPPSDPVSDLDFYVQNNVGDANLTNRFFGVQVEVANAPAVTVPDEELTVTGYLAPVAPTSVSVTPAVTQGGSPVTPDSLTVIGQATHGTASVSGDVLTYSPASGYSGADSFTYKATVAGVDSNTATVSVTVVQNLDAHNCDCNDTTGNRTLAQLRSDLMVRLGFAAQKNNPPPGMTDLLNSFLIEAQELLYRRYSVLRTLRFYSWNLQAGVRFYDINSNAETCTKTLDPRKVAWAGINMNDTWYPLICGIPPELYSGNAVGWPQRYEIRQCIEVWPLPDATNGALVIKGDFGLEPFAADTDTTTIDDRLVFLLALANAKAHYRRPDASNYIAQMEQMMVNLVAGSHNTRRYIPGQPRDFDMIYTAPKPTVPFP